MVLVDVISGKQPAAISSDYTLIIFVPASSGLCIYALLPCSGLFGRLNACLFIIDYTSKVTFGERLLILAPRRED